MARSKTLWLSYSFSSKYSCFPNPSIGIRTSRDLDISVLNICDISVLGTGHLGTRYWTSRYSVLKISVLNNKNNLIEFKNCLNNFFTTEIVKLQLKIRVCFEKNHMSTPPPPFSITDYKNQVPHKHCRSTEGQTRMEQFLDLIGRVLNWSKD
jgi:hypothetical protein